MKKFYFNLKYFAVTAILIFMGVAIAAESMGPGQDRDVMERAKSKRYRNGAEEGELRVQAQLYKPQRKVAPVIEKSEDENEQDRD